ncbi:hypothetical protein JCM3774_006684 [Rhodotorula dairenensis]
MSGQGMQATARSPLDWVACSRCHAPYNPPLPFFLTDCAHTLCQACTAQATQLTSASEAGAQGGAPVVCPACRHAGPVVRLDLAASLQHCFRPLQDLLGELGMAAEWQIVNLVDQLAYFREKCADQKQMLARAASELKKMRDLKESVASSYDRVTELTQQNQALQQQLASAPPPQPALPRQAPLAQPARSPAQFAANDQNVPPAYGQPSRQGQGQPRGQKRPRDSPGRSASGPPSRSPSVASAPIAPARLSLTPAQQKQAAARISAHSSVLQQIRPHAPQGSAVMVDANGRTSRAGGPVMARPTEETSKDRLARFAYNPSRAADRSAAATPASPHQRFAPTDHFREEQRETLSYYHPARPTAGSGSLEDDGQQRRQYDFGSHADGGFTHRANDRGGGPELPAHDDRDGDQRLMPPPPVPTTRRQQGANHRSETSASRLGTSDRTQQHMPHADQRTHPFSTSTAHVTAQANPLPSVRAASTSHRHPFRPASAAATEPSVRAARDGFCGSSLASAHTGWTGGRSNGF